MAPRKAAVLARNLPAGAQVWMDSTGDRAWGPSEYLMAHVIDILNIGNWQRAGDKKAKKPKPVPRPVDQRAAAARTDAQVSKGRRWLERRRTARQQQTALQDF